VLRGIQSIWFLNTAVMVPCISGDAHTWPSDHSVSARSSLTCRQSQFQGLVMRSSQVGLHPSCCSHCGIPDAGSAAAGRSGKRAKSKTQPTGEAPTDLRVVLQCGVPEWKPAWVEHANVSAHQLQKARALKR